MNKVAFNLGYFTEVLLHKRLTKVITDSMNDLGISPESYDIQSLLPPAQIRNILIRNEYIQRRHEGEKAERLWCLLADKYGLKYDTIKAILSSRR